MSLQKEQLYHLRDRSTGHGLGIRISTIAGASNKVTKLKALLYIIRKIAGCPGQVHGVNLSLDEFEKTIAAVNNISEGKETGSTGNRRFPSSLLHVECQRLDLFLLGLTVKAGTKFILRPRSAVMVRCS